MTDKGPAPNLAPDLAEQFADAIAWWREAGVDSDYADDATSWLREKEVAESGAAGVSAHPIGAPAQPVATEKPLEQLGGDPANWPQDLDAFGEWWLAEPSLDAGGINPRVPPRGPQGAALMVVVAEPEADDRDTLLAGPHGQLLGAMLDAMEVAHERVYFASALPRHMPMPDWARLTSMGLGKLLAHHLALVKPERLLVLGRNIPPLFGHDMAQEPAGFGKFLHDSMRIRATMAPGLAHLMRSAPARAKFWRLWLDWTDGDE